jgi:hypothetical protein
MDTFNTILAFLFIFLWALLFAYNSLGGISYTLTWIEKILIGVRD